MGVIVEIDDRVSVELRRESFVLTVGDEHASIGMEIDYRDTAAVQQAIGAVTKSNQFASDQPRRVIIARSTLPATHPSVQAHRRKQRKQERD